MEVGQTLSLFTIGITGIDACTIPLYNRSMRYKNTNYLVSADGVIFNAKTGKAIKPVPKKSGYLEVRISVNGKVHCKSHHRLVWEACNGSIPEGMHVNHINQNTHDNRLENLEICTPAENQERRNLCKGEQVNTSKLTEEQAREIKYSSLRTSELLKIHPVSRSAINRIKSGITWKHV